MTLKTNLPTQTHAKQIVTEGNAMEPDDRDGTPTDWDIDWIFAEPEPDPKLIAEIEDELTNPLYVLDEDGEVVEDEEPDVGATHDAYFPDGDD